VIVTDAPVHSTTAPATTAIATNSGDREPKDFEVYGDSAFADGATLDEQAQRGHDMRTKVAEVAYAGPFELRRVQSSTASCWPDMHASDMQGFSRPLRGQGCR
jgi:hypothetical protein